VAMNIYDTANRLAQEIKESEEYVTYKMAKEAINLRPDLKEKIAEFEKARYEVQILKLQTGKEDAEKLSNMQKLYADLIAVEEVKKYFDAEISFNVAIADINKIIGEAIKDLVN
jgi:cell fate (sporulation/competence/biofilm development) regulator YlbF (YheA/YmcA/DUF963 family)